MNVHYLYNLHLVRIINDCCPLDEPVVRWPLIAYNPINWLLISIFFFLYKFFFFLYQFFFSYINFFFLYQFFFFFFFFLINFFFFFFREEVCSRDEGARSSSGNWSASSSARASLDLEPQLVNANFPSQDLVNNNICNNNTCNTLPDTQLDNSFASNLNNNVTVSCQPTDSSQEQVDTNCQQSDSTASNQETDIESGKQSEEESVPSCQQSDRTLTPAASDSSDAFNAPVRASPSPSLEPESLPSE